ncbi:MAG: DTW domain-containing protein [Oleibacter sp.]|nr:DTW domain-containing protein [Thalassolituus sp.]
MADFINSGIVLRSSYYLNEINLPSDLPDISTATDVISDPIARLRLNILRDSRRPFLARGANLVRCSHCLLVDVLCICDQRPKLGTELALCLVFYPGEVFKPSNTGRLIADVIADSHAVQWQRKQPPADLKTLLDDARYAPIVVFPYEYAETERQLREDSDLYHYIAGRKPLLIFLDGTWREARKMFRSDWLAGLPVIGIEPETVSQYQLRESFHDHQWATAEVAIPLLTRLNETAAGAALAEYFMLFRERYLDGKANRYVRAQVKWPED